MSLASRLHSGFLLRRLQRGELLALPESRPMPTIGPRCHELRINEWTAAWRIYYRIDRDAVVVVEVLRKKTQTTPHEVIETCRRQLAAYDRLNADYTEH